MYNIKEVMKALADLEQRGLNYANFNNLKDTLLITGVSDNGFLSVIRHDIRNEASNIVDKS